VADALVDCVLEVSGVLLVHVDTLGVAVVLHNTIAVKAAASHHTAESMPVFWHLDTVRVRMAVTFLLPRRKSVVSLLRVPS
jgi:hypothetical protein